MGGLAANNAAEASPPAARKGRRQDQPLDCRGLAPDKKGAARRGAHLVLIDESGAMMAPLVRRSLAPRGQTPVIEQRASHRDRVSLVAALSLSPKRRHIGLHFRTLPRDYVNQERTAEFLRQLLRQLRHEVVVVWDRGNMHRGWAIRDVLQRFPRLKLEPLPPYAPELNPVEFLWNHLKYGKLANYAPKDVPELNTRLRRYLRQAKKSTARLQSLYESAQLPFW
jgi:transposase